MSGAPALIGDIGGTNARFALTNAGGVPQNLQVLRCADHPDIASAIRAYLGAEVPETRPDRAALAVAAPVLGDDISMTNHPWRFSVAALQRELGLDDLRVVNDFAAIALALPTLGTGDLRAIGGGQAASDAPRAAIGPGTGLGVSALVKCGDGWTPVATEGGHVTLAAGTEREAEIVARLRDRFGHVSAERVVSGPGLRNLYCAVTGSGTAPEPEAITAAAIAGDDAAAAAFALFGAWLGSVAGDLALTLGARGGVYVAGGIAPSVADALAASEFRARFEDKGRYRGYLSKIPTWIVTHPQPALAGLAALVEAP